MTLARNKHVMKFLREQKGKRGAGPCSSHTGRDRTGWRERDASDGHGRNTGANLHWGQHSAWSPTGLHASSHSTLRITLLVRSIIPTFSSEKAEAQEDFIICPSLTAAVAGAMTRRWQSSQKPALCTLPTSHFRATPGGLGKEQKHPTQPICIKEN